MKRLKLNSGVPVDSAKTQIISTAAVNPTSHKIFGSLCLFIWVPPKGVLEKKNNLSALVKGEGISKKNGVLILFPSLSLKRL